MKIGKLDIGIGIGILDAMLVFVPATIALYMFHAPGAWVFASACLGIIPLAGLMGRATEGISEHMGPGIGGFLNATLGNAAELIIAVVALKAGYYDVVKASITGSIIGNVMLVLGACMIAGGVRYKILDFDETAVGVNATMLLLSTAGLVIPAVFVMLLKGQSVAPDKFLMLDRHMSLAIAVILFITYILSLVFTMHTHKHLYDGSNLNTGFGSGSDAPPVKADDNAGCAGLESDAEPAEGLNLWSVRKSIMVLVGATVGVAIMSELLVHTLEEITRAFGMTEVFVGVILLAIVGNAAEHSTAVMMAMKNKMDIAVNIAIGSSTQIALFVAPLLVFLSYAIGPQPMDLVFTDLEVLSVVLASVLVNFMALDGKSHWMEGVQLVAVYLILAAAFYFLPQAGF
jgi:Ca2+:H+ antiporter